MALDRIKASDIVSCAGLIGSKRVPRWVVAKVGLVHQLIVEAGRDGDIVAC